jgi:PAS domain-containing protein
VILDVNYNWLNTLGRSSDELLGQDVFTVFPKMPRGPEGPGVTALEFAAVSRRREVTHLTRYDFEDPGRPGVFEERYWSSVVTPLRTPDGQVEILELSAREVTSIISDFRSLQARHHG